MNKITKTEESNYNFLLREKLAAKILNMSYDKLKRVRYAGDIEFIKFGKSIRYKNEHLKNYIQAHEVEATA